MRKAEMFLQAMLTERTLEKELPEYKVYLDIDEEDLGFAKQLGFRIRGMWSLKVAKKIANQLNLKFQNGVIWAKPSKEILEIMCLFKKPFEVLADLDDCIVKIGFIGTKI